MHALELAQHLRAELTEIARARVQLDAAAGPDAREIQQLIDHARHPLAARKDSTERFGLAVGRKRVSFVAHQEELRRRENAAERISKIVRQDSREELVRSDRLLER